MAFPTLVPTLAKPPKKPGAPRVLVVAGAALRVADLCRDAREFKSKETDVAKLFAKHFKLSEHVEYLKTTKVSIAVGTPGRIAKLLSDTEVLSLTHLSYILIDATYHNAKQQSVVDMPDCRFDLFSGVLGQSKVRERLKQGRCKLVIF